eukprot:8485028-Heterocapsa_arctica.AAC.1
MSGSLSIPQGGRTAGSFSAASRAACARASRPRELTSERSWTRPCPAHADYRGPPHPQAGVHRAGPDQQRHRLHAEAAQAVQGDSSGINREALACSCAGRSREKSRRAASPETSS